MNGCVAHRACLIFLRKVVGWPGRTRHGVTLQAQHAGLTHPQQSGIGATMRCVTTCAAFRFDRQMLKDEGPLLVGMTLRTHRVTTGDTTHVPQSACAVQIVAIRTLDQPFVDSVMKRLREIGFGCRVASIAKLRLSLHQEPLRFVGVMRRVAVQTADIAARMPRTAEMGLAVAISVATQAAPTGLLP